MRNYSLSKSWFWEKRGIRDNKSLTVNSSARRNIVRLRKGFKKKEEIGF